MINNLKREREIKMRKMSHAEKRESEWDSLFMITNRCFDVVIMFLSTFTLIYFCNGDWLTAIALLIADLIIIPINNGPQAFQYFHKQVSAWRSAHTNTTKD